VNQHGKHQFLVDLSRTTARGQITTAKAGYLNGQRAPYGYDRMLLNDKGEHVQRIADGEKIARPKSWKVTLVPSDDPVKVETARWLFDAYAKTDTGIRQLAEMLNAKGIPAPNGGPWWMGTIREILRNPAYVGDRAWSRRSMGKYHRVAAGDIRPRIEGGPKVRHNPPEEWTVRPDTHPALIDRDTWKLVQKKLAERQERGGRRSRASDRYLLSGLVFCGHCGRRMHGTIKSRQKKGKRYTREKYICSTCANGGKHFGCGYHTVDQHELLAFLLAKLRDAVLAGGHRAKLREKIVAQLRSRQQADPALTKQLETKLAELDRQIKQGTERLL
jgi:site-specific DNA recombinase